MSTIEATITTVQQDANTGWYRVATDDERIKRLDTKDSDRAKQAAALKGRRSRITFSEKESNNINPHTNRPYMDRYFEAAEALNSQSADGIEIVQQGQQTGRKTDPNDAWRMCLNKGGELAVMTLPLMPDDQRSFEIQKQIATAWAKFFYFTPLPAEGVNTAAAALGFGDAPQPDFTSSAAAPDDIPY